MRLRERGECLHTKECRSVQKSMQIFPHHLKECRGKKKKLKIKFILFVFAGNFSYFFHLPALETFYFFATVSKVFFFTHFYDFNKKKTSEKRNEITTQWKNIMRRQLSSESNSQALAELFKKVYVQKWKQKKTRNGAIERKFFFLSFFPYFIIAQVLNSFYFIFFRKNNTSTRHRQVDVTIRRKTTTTIPLDRTKRNFNCVMPFHLQTKKN